VIKLFTFNTNPSTVLTPTTNALSLTVTSPMPQPWPVESPTRFEGAIEIARYKDVTSMLSALGHVNLYEFIAKSHGFRWYAEENVVIPGTLPPSPNIVKLTAFVARKEGMSRAAYLKYYPTVHAPLVKKTPELPRYVQNYIMSDDETTYDLEYDGVAELWWPDRDTAFRSWASPEIQVEQGADVLNFLSMRSLFIYGDEKQIV